MLTELRTKNSEFFSLNFMGNGPRFRSETDPGSRTPWERSSTIGCDSSSLLIHDRGVESRPKTGTGFRAAWKEPQSRPNTDTGSRTPWEGSSTIGCNSSSLLIHDRGVEQLVARRAHNPKVAGSSPVPATRFYCKNPYRHLSIGISSVCWERPDNQ